MTTDTHWILAEDGRFARYSHAVSGAGETRSEPVNGVWQATNDVLRFESEDGAVEEHAYYLEGDNLLLPQQSHFRLWQRV
jgi:hypothetical protein